MVRLPQAYTSVYYIFTNNLQLRTTTLQTIQTRRSSQMTSMTATRTATATETPRMKRNSTKTTMIWLMMMIMLRDTHGASRTFLPG
jgi:hypothetical protein